MKSCSEINRLISSYLDDEIDVKERIEVEEHLKTCGQCRTEVDEIREVIELCRDMDEVELPHNFKEELHRRLVEVSMEEKRGNKLAFLRKPYVKVLSSIAAALILVFAAKGLYDYGYFSPARYESTQREASTAQTPQDQMDMAVESAEAQENAAAEQFSTAMAADAGNADVVMVKGANRNGADERKTKWGESGTGVTRSHAGVTLYFDANSDINLQKEKVTAFVLEHGAELAEPAASRITAAFSEQAAPEGGAELNIKVPTSKYGEFIDEMAAEFGRENLLVGETETVDMGAEVEKYNARLAELDKIIKDLESGENNSYALSLDEAKRERDAIQAEIERIELDSSYTFIRVLLKARQ